MGDVLFIAITIAIVICVVVVVIADPIVVEVSAPLPRYEPHRYPLTIGNPSNSFSAYARTKGRLIN